MMGEGPAPEVAVVLAALVLLAQVAQARGLSMVEKVLGAIVIPKRIALVPRTGWRQRSLWLEASTAVAGAAAGVKRRQDQRF